MIVYGLGKINLSLSILRKREDGYHEVDMIMQSISLADRIKISEIPEGIEIESNQPHIPIDSRNLVWQAAELLKKKYGIKKGVHVYLEKQIPYEAGLAGGSSDAAATLRGLNRLWGLGISIEKLRKLGARIGSDVPFCITGGTVRATGRGEKIEQLKDVPEFAVLLLKPQIGISTQKAYEGYQQYGVKLFPDIEKMSRAIQKGDKEGIRSHLGNVFEEWIPNRYPEIRKCLDTLKDKGARGVGMSGSGPTVFALADSIEEAQGWAEGVQHLGQTWICKTMGMGWEEEEW